VEELSRTQIRSVRALFALALIAVSIAILLLFGAFRPANAAATGEYEYSKKITICHHTGSNKNPTVTITVSENAVPAHLAHGDTLGPCPED
jgi:hypothetical protein